MEDSAARDDGGSIDVQQAISIPAPDLASGICVEIKDVDYCVPAKTGTRNRLLLTGVSGCIRRRSITALMGPSGSGKSTLLDIISGRKLAQRGAVLYGDHRPTKQFLERFTSLVEQFDTLIGNFTVYEMLLYTMELKSPSVSTAVYKQMKIDSIVDRLGLQACKNTRIGAAHTGISGGQAKRVSIGLALVTDVHVLGLDEPTSGLDSYTATEVLKMLRKVANGGVTVVAAIHSPTSYAFQLFDDLIILIHGRVVYAGPNALSGRAVQYHFTDSEDASVQQNLAEWIVALVTQADLDGRVEEMASKMAAAYEETRAASGSHAEFCSCGASDAAQTQLQIRKATNTPFRHALWTLLKFRGVKDYSDPNFVLPRVLDKVFVAFFLTTLYWGLGSHKSSTNVSNITALLFMWATLPGFTVVSYIPAIVMDKPLFRRERQDGLYSALAYLLCKLLEECLLSLGTSIFMSAAVFFAVGLQGNWLLFWAAFYLTTCTGIVLAYAIAAGCATVDAANAALPAYVLTLQFFVGLLIRIADIPNYWQWYAKLNFLSYSWKALMINHFQHEAVGIYDNVETLTFYGLHGEHAWSQLGIALSFFAAFFAIALLALQWSRP